MGNYTYQTGLKILKYFDEDNLTDVEKELIKEKWDYSYRSYNRDPIATIRHLYVGILPFWSHSKNPNSVCKKRERDFEKKLREKKLARENLDEILEKITL